MLSKCANPFCSEAFRYFHQGKLFRMETESNEAGPGRGKTAKSVSRVEFFWLCDHCASEMTVECDGKGRVGVTPLDHELREAS